MKRDMRQIVSILSILILLFTCAPYNGLAAESDNSNEEEVAVDLDMEDDLNLGEEIFPEGCETEFSEDEDLGTGEIVDGIYEDSEIVVPEDDLGSGEEVVEDEVAFKVSAGRSNNSEEELGAGSPYIGVSSSSLSVSPGSAKRITVTAYNFSSGYIGATNTNGTVCAIKYDSKWSGNSIGLTITGKKAGNATIRIYLLNNSKNEVASKTISASVSSNAKLNLSATSISLSKNETATVNASYSGYSGYIYFSAERSRNAPFTCEWGTRSGNYFPLKIRGTALGSGTIKIYLKAYDSNEILSTKTINVSVSSNPKITASQSSVTVSSGSTVPVTFTVSGTSGTTQLVYSTTNVNAYSCSWGTYNGTSATCTIKGLNAGSGKVTVYLKNLSGSTLASTSVSVSVSASSSAKVISTLSSANIKIGNSVQAIMSYENVGAVGTVTISCNNSDKTVCTTKWGLWSNHKIPLTITGLKNGTATETISLKQKSTGQVLATTKITVKVSQSENSTLQKISYKFKNFRKTASIDICRYMFGNNSRARIVYDDKTGADGNCFGMASSSSLFYVSGSGVNLNQFGNNRTMTSQFERTDASNYYTVSNKKMTIEQFILAMQVAQLSWDNWDQIYCSVSDMGKLISNVQNQSNYSKPVMLSIPSPRSGRHAVLAYGTERVSNTHQRLLLYDNNFTLKTRYLDIYSDSSGRYTSWTFEFQPGDVWSSSSVNKKIYYCNFDSFKKLWDKRGRLSDDGSNLMIANSDNLEIYDANNTMIARIEDGLLSTNNAKIEQIDCSTKDGDADNVSRLLLPTDLYTVKNNDPSIKLFKVDIVNEDLGIQVNGESDKITVCADDSCNLVSALMTPGNDDEFQIKMLSSRNGEPETITWDGVGNGDLVSATLNDGTLETCNTEDAQLSMGDVNGSSDKPAGTQLKKTSISKLTKAKKAFTVKWKKSKDKISGYQIMYSTNKNFKSNTKTINVKSSKTKQSIKKLKSKKKYYVRIRTYKKTDLGTYYSAWSKVKTVKTK